MEEMAVESLSTNVAGERKAGPSCETFDILSLFGLHDSGSLLVGLPPFQDLLLSRRMWRVTSKGLQPVIRLLKVASS